MSINENVRRIEGSAEWEQLKGVLVEEESLILERLGDLSPYRPTPSPQFPNVKTVILRKCDKNFFCYWIRPDLFPKLEDIWLIESHPCDSYYLWRYLKHPKITVHISEYYYNYYVVKRNWINEEKRDQFKSITEEKADSMMRLYSSQE